MFPEIAAAAEKLDPGAAAAAAAAFEASSWGSRPAALPSAADVAAEEQMLAAAASAPAVLAEPDAADGSKLDAGSSEGSKASAAAEQHGSSQLGLRVVRPSAALEALPRSAVRRALERAGLGRPQLLPALHMAVLVAVAGVLIVCRAAYVGLDERSVWVAITGARCARRVAHASLTGCCDHQCPCVRARSAPLPLPHVGCPHPFPTPSPPLPSPLHHPCPTTARSGGWV